MRRAVTVAFLLIGLLFGPNAVNAQSTPSMADYTAITPFIADTVKPNILIIFDNSGSMQILAHAASASFSNSNSYTGIFEPTECYEYTTAVTGGGGYRANPAVNPASPGTCTTSPYLWSGNLLNYVTMRRIDIAKQVMIGGNCETARDAQDKCTTVIKAQDANFQTKGDKQASASKSGIQNLIPSSVCPGGGAWADCPSTFYFHHAGATSTALAGKFCIDNDSSYPPSGSTDCNDTFNTTPYRIAVELTQPSFGVFQEVGDKARFAMKKYAGWGIDGGPLIAEMGTSTTDLVNTLDATKPPGGTGTPLAEVLYESALYFAQVTPPYELTHYSYTDINKDPYYFTAPQWASTSTYVNCCKSYVILFTDGEPTSDQNIPSALQDYAHAIHGSHCTGAGCNGHRTDYGSGSHYLDDVAYWAHTTDLRQATIPVINKTGKDLPGFQNLTVYTFFAFGSDSELMKSAAKAGAFVDRNGNNIPDNGLTPAGPCVLTPTPGPCEYDEVNNLTGAAGADGVPDAYFESEDANFLKDRLLAVISSILERSASGTAASVLASSSTGEGALYQSFFFPNTVENLQDVKWTGYTQGLFVDAFGNLREDSDQDGRLVYKNDKIVQTRFDSGSNEVVADLFVDVSPEDGKADSTTPTTTVALKAIVPIWEAGKELALRNLSSNARNILTWIDKDNDGRVDATEQVAFSTANATDLAPYLRPGAAPFDTNNIIKFIRGEPVTGLRNRQITVNGSSKTWRLGDSIHSTPTVVGGPAERYDVIYGDASYTDFFLKYKSRRHVAYVGANDGMLHAFNAGFFHKGDDASTTNKVEHGYFTTTDAAKKPPLGEELWGFIPQELLPHLQWLARPDYSHVYYVDLKPKVTDARIFTPDTDHPNGWGTILIGGFRLGGSCGACVAGTGAPPMTVNADFNNDGDTDDGDDTRTFYSAYFVLDITNPEVDPKLLWAYSSSTLGLTTSFPAVVRANPSADGKTSNTDAKWYVVLGSGPTSYDVESTQGGKILVLEMAKPWAFGKSLDVTTFPTSDVNDFVGDVVSVDKDLDYRADVTYMGSVIKSSSPTWQGKMYRLSTASGIPDTAKWANKLGNVTELLATYNCSPTPCGLSTVGPVVSAPAVTLDDARQLWVFFGTGRYFSDADKTDAETQYFFGVKDPVMLGGTGACKETGIQVCGGTKIVVVSSATVCVVCDAGTDEVTGLTGVDTLEGTATTTLQGLVASRDGWVTSLPTTRERVLFSPTLIGGIVFFPSFTPVDDMCASSGDSELYALFYLTGSAYSESVVGTETVGGNTNVLRSISRGAGLVSQAAVHIGAQGTDAATSVTGRIKICSQSDSGALTCTRTNPPLSSWSRYVSWLGQRML